MITFNRRNMLVTGVATAALAPAAARAGVSTKGAAATLSGPYVDLATPEGNVNAWARINGSIDPAVTSYSWYSGRVTGMRPGEAARDLMRIIGMGAVRLLPLADGKGYQMLRKELGFFLDLESGQVLDRWHNSYTNEAVEVVHIANPAINARIEAFPLKQGLYEAVDDPKGRPPFILPWTQIRDRAVTEQHVHLWAKNPLDPAIWVRESSGLNIAISDSNTYAVSLADLQNPRLNKIPSIGNWTHSRPWQPWMLMGQAPGSIQYNCITASSDQLEDLPPQIVDLARTRFPDFLEAPRVVTRAESSLARYMRTRKPAPPIAVPDKQP
ncbi:MAG: DUF1838 family protein [Sandarakinorhabdus sp.]|nr:DUF1838 family protein [Sandarakinorhabdus sp.]